MSTPQSPLGKIGNIKGTSFDKTFVDYLDMKDELKDGAPWDNGWGDIQTIDKVEYITFDSKYRTIKYKYTFK
jgi:hypothetical protein